MMHFIRITLLSAVTAALAGCNPFLENYNGQKFPHNSAAQALIVEPTGATKIGESKFYSIDDYSNDQAISAAENVGADFVIWDKKNAGEQTDWVPQPMVTSAGPMTTTTVNVPVPVTRMWYEYVASFYRKDSDTASGSSDSG